jgi:murein tripeptide amidase MpaA
MDSIQGKLILSMCEIQANRQESLIQSKLYREGLVPVCRVMPGKAEWSRIPLKCFNTGENDKNIKFSFRYTFPEGAERVYFAYTFPWSLNDNNKFLDKLIAKNAHREDIYIKREVATLSFEGRPMDMLTITGSNGKLEEREELIPGLFPNSDPSKRPLKFAQKKYIWVSSRVHPGEIAASHMLNGFLGMLLSDPSRDVRVKLALHHFVFVIVPMLNPDGVYRGHYRTDTHGNNLNRCYLNPDPKTMPTIYAADKIIESTPLSH